MNFIEEEVGLTQQLTSATLPESDVLCGKGYSFEMEHKIRTYTILKVLSAQDAQIKTLTVNRILIIYHMLMPQPSSVQFYVCNSWRRRRDLAAAPAPTVAFDAPSLFPALSMFMSWSFSIV